MSARRTIPARHGVAARVTEGSHIRVINTHGNQVVDTWLFNADDPAEFQSNEHSRSNLMNLSIKLGDTLYSNRRRPMARLVEDTSPGVHDLLVAACDQYRYRQLGCTDDHRNCVDNLVESMREFDYEVVDVPCPINLFMNIPWTKAGKLEWGTPLAKPGDYVVFQALMNCIVSLSACPQDILPVNGHNPVDAHFEVF